MILVISGFPYQKGNSHLIWNFHILSRISILEPELPYQIRNIHIRSRISISDHDFHIRSGISISDPEFPFQIRNFHFRSDISILDPESPIKIWNFHIRTRISNYDPEVQYQIWNFHIRSRISISDPEFPYQILNFHIIIIFSSNIYFSINSFTLLFHCERLSSESRYCQLIMLRNHAIIWMIWQTKSSLLERLNLFSGPG
jgi:hypothetical protein